MNTPCTQQQFLQAGTMTHDSYSWQFVHSATKYQDHVFELVKDCFHPVDARIEAHDRGVETKHLLPSVQFALCTLERNEEPLCKLNQEKEH